jgi:hypothetical protein
MERWKVYEEIKTYIRHIYRFSGEGQECTVFFYDKTKRKYALHFDFVFDARYAIEDAFCSRVARRPWTDLGTSTGIYIVEDSDYLKYFEEQNCGVYQVNSFQHFILFDTIDTGIEVLTKGLPVLSELID